MIEIPLTGAPKESIDIKLGKRLIEVRSSYANLTNTWTLDFFDRSGSPRVPLVRGVVAVMGADLLKPYRLGLGSLFAIPTNDPRRDAGPGDLGVRIKLIHIAEGEVLV